MATLQKQLSRKVGNKKYPKYVVVISPKIIAKAGLKEGQKLKIEIEKEKVIISKG